MADILRVSVIQCPTVWESREANLNLYADSLKRLNGKTDLAILPETFSTGFSMDVRRLAEQPNGKTISTIKEWAERYGFAIAGSFIATENSLYYNRAFLITPEGECHFYDKRHLFRMGQEDRYFSMGQERKIIRYKGWNICPQVCYDLRFPVWSRNRSNEYDLLLYMANWPEARRSAWMSLLPARAIENICYVCGVNRTGTDGKGFSYHGDSMILSPKGERLAYAGKRQRAILTCLLAKNELDEMRSKFPAWKDADQFSITT